MINLFIHPGFPKTGSSYLKRKVFKHAGYNLYPADDTPGFNKFETIHFKLFKKDLQLNKNPFNQIRQPLSHYYLKNEYKKYLINCFSKNENYYVLSDSAFFGDFQLNGSSKSLYLFKEIIDEIIQEKKIEIKIKFIVSIRNQFDFIRSIYNYTFEHFDKMSFENLVEKVCDNRDKSFYYFFEFESIIKSIKKIYNCEILILPIEKLSENPDNYIKDLEKFLNFKLKIPSEDLNSKENINYFNNNDGGKIYLTKRLSTSYLYFVLSKFHVTLKKYDFYNKNFKKSKLLNTINNIFKPKTKSKIEKKIKNELELRKKIFITYLNSNKEMARVTGTDLKKYNYY